MLYYIIVWMDTLWSSLVRYIFGSMFVSIELCNTGSYCLMPISNLIAMNRFIQSKKTSKYMCNKYVVNVSIDKK